eukprot:gnl/TRDRNA2_/TRDRNA2_174661_c0_seq2.p1 gnl/TRDRNA2_/TRDRNA2_174661_c0~~gnl/TRDRNA2_/TRDRNA2_174661_c0_seq2.p1  ORF type:complete len:255 (-),score=34.96 gnl/TRDRNA2_/TRDRNA2_174661_c0_seq2:460-1140(-)
MYSQLPVCDDRHHGSKVHVCKSITLGFGAGLLLGALVTMALLHPSLPGTSAAEPSSLVASQFSMATGNSVTSDRSAVIANSWRFTHDGRGHPQIGAKTAVMEKTPAQGQYSPEQLELLQRASKALQEQSYQQPANSQPTSTQGKYSPEQLAFLRRAGKLPSEQEQQEQQQQPTSAQGQYSESQLAFMRRKMEQQYKRPVTASWETPAAESVGRRDGYSRYSAQKFS